MVTVDQPIGQLRHSRHQDFCVMSMVFQFMVYELALSTARAMSMALTRMFDELALDSTGKGNGIFPLMTTKSIILSAGIINNDNQFHSIPFHSIPYFTQCRKSRA